MTTFESWTLEQLETRARLNALRGIATSQALRDEIARRRQQPVRGATNTYIVMCRVSGGVTGTRESQLKANGVPQFFSTREMAQAEADKLNSDPRPYATARFAYWVEEA